MASTPSPLLYDHLTKNRAIKIGHVRERPCEMLTFQTLGSISFLLVLDVDPHSASLHSLFHI